MSLLEPPLGLHEGGVLVARVVVGEVGVGGRSFGGGCCSGGGGCCGPLGCCGGSGSLILWKVNGDLDVSQRVLDKRIV